MARKPKTLDALPPRDADERVLAVIEAAAGSRNKTKYMPEYGAFVQHKLLPLGTSFPYDFGFVPGTLGDDGDPLDVLVFMDEPVAVGTLVPCRLIGIVEAEQSDDGAEFVRNDRLLAVACHSERYSQCATLADLAPGIVERIEDFFVQYNLLQGKQFRPLARHGPRKADDALAAGRKRYKRER